MGETTPLLSTRGTRAREWLPKTAMLHRNAMAPTPTQKRISSKLPTAYCKLWSVHPTRAVAHPPRLRGGLGRGLNVPHIDEICCKSWELGIKCLSSPRPVPLSRHLLQRSCSSLRVLCENAFMPTAFAHEGNHATCFNAGDHGGAVAPQDRAASPQRSGSPCLPFSLLLYKI